MVKQMLKKINIRQPKVDRYYCSVGGGYYAFFEEGIGCIFQIAVENFDKMTLQDRKDTGIDNADYAAPEIDTLQMLHIVNNIYEDAKDIYLLKDK